MKRTLSLASCVLGLTLWGTGLPHAHAQQTAVDRSYAQFSAASSKILDKLDAYNKLVASIRDLPAAKAAKPKIVALTSELQAATNAAAALGTPSPEVEKRMISDQAQLERAGIIQNEMSRGGRHIIMDKALFAELQPVLAAFQKAMKPGATAAPAPAPVKPAANAAAPAPKAAQVSPK